MEPTSGTLYVVATPIGNLEDITLRALRVLRECDALLCEDTRVTAKLLAKFEITKSLESFHEHTSSEKRAHVLRRLQGGESFALVTDAGTPGLSDPGNRFVAEAADAGIPVVAVPGVSAVAALVSVAGIDLREFHFKGFPPHKKGRETFFRTVAASAVPVAYYESPHRFVKNLELLGEFAPEKRLIVGRELTKLHEDVRRGPLAAILAHYRAHPDTVRGEFSVIVY